MPSPTREKPIPLAERVLKGPSADNLSVSDLGGIPGDDPKKKWIVFLQAQEHRRGAPEVKRSPVNQWHIPQSDEAVAAIREALMPAEWGEEKDGLRMGLRLRNSTAPRKARSLLMCPFATPGTTTARSCSTGTTFTITGRGRGFM